jgi:DNA mismatch repair ATPase MutS
MKAHLMFHSRDFDAAQEPPAHAPDLIQDLGLAAILEAMADGDPFLLDVATKALLRSLCDPDEIVYRQQILRDCLQHETVVRSMYNLALEVVSREKRLLRGFFRHPDAVLNRSREALQLFLRYLTQLRTIAEDNVSSFSSDGFRTLFAMLSAELADDYVRRVQKDLEQLRFRNGVLISVRLGAGNKGTNYVLRRSLDTSPRWWQWLTVADDPTYTIRIPERDESGASALAELRDRGVNFAANALAQSADHIISFFRMLQTELAFYIGCLNLHERLGQKGEPVCFPTPAPPRRHLLCCRGLYDAGLSLTLPERLVGNDVDADDARLIVVTGANQGGKSTFLRSVGIAQLMMQCGMFVPAREFRASCCTRLFTHYRREEDRSMRSGKLDEELARMSDIADRIEPHGLLLSNESFGATNEKEGSEIARQIFLALADAGVRTVAVTHLYDLAARLYRQHPDFAIFLRAERRPDGERTFRLVPAGPLATSFGEDVYRRVFGADGAEEPLPA